MLPGLEDLVFVKPVGEQNGYKIGFSITASRRQVISSAERVFKVSQRYSETLLHAHLWQRTRSEAER